MRAKGNAKGSTTEKTTREQTEKTTIEAVVKTPVVKTHRIAVASLKGGVGKTAVSALLSRALARLTGKPVLAIDLDHNNNLTDYFLRNVDADTIESANVYHVLTGRRSLADCIYETGKAGGEAACNDAGRVSVLPATPYLSRSGIELVRDPGAVLRFARSIKDSGYDTVVLDTPPSLSFELTCALYSSCTVLSPLSFSRWTVQGYQLLQDEIAGVAEATGRPPALLALPVQVNDTQSKKLRMAGIEGMLSSVIHRSAAIKSACDTGKPLKEGSRSYEEFLSLAEELLC